MRKKITKRRRPMLKAAILVIVSLVVVGNLPVYLQPYAEAETGKAIHKADVTGSHAATDGTEDSKMPETVENSGGGGAR